MFFPLVTIDDFPPSTAASHPRLVRDGGGKGKSFTAAFLSAAVPHHQLPTPTASISSIGAEDKLKSEEDEEDELRLSDYLDIPLLVSDNEEEDSEGESSSKGGNFPKTINAHPPAVAAAQAVKRSIRQEEHIETEKTPPVLTPQVSAKEESVAPVAVAGSESSVDAKPLSAAELAGERSKVMKIVVKYVAMKISNSFPPESPRTADPNEMPLDQFLMILVSRLQLTLPLFMKGTIYLFRYMDIIYLLRYLNQSNNFANYTDMGFCLKKLIIGCFRLTLARERITKDWSGITGMNNAQINTIVKTVVGRLNGKLTIKNIELVRLRTEIFRFVKMVTKTV